MQASFQKLKALKYRTVPTLSTMICANIVQRCIFPLVVVKHHSKMDDHVTKKTSNDTYTPHQKFVDDEHT